MFSVSLTEPDEGQSKQRLVEMRVTNLEAPGEVALEEYAAVPCKPCPALNRSAALLVSFG